jgi:LEA14-like dessication related protein
MHSTSSTTTWAIAAAAVIAFACSKPQPPTLTPKQATVTGLTLAAIDMRIQVDAQNSNNFDLVTRSVTAKVKVDGKYDLGSYTSTTALTIPAGKSATIDVPVSIKWNDITQLAMLAAQGRPVPYAVDGTASIGGSTLNVDVPFHIDGTLTQQDLANAVSNSLQPH